MINTVSATSDTNDISLDSDTTDMTIAHTDTHTNDKTSSKNNDAIINRKNTEIHSQNNTKDSLKKTEKDRIETDTNNLLTKKDTVTSKNKNNILTEKLEEGGITLGNCQSSNNEISNIQEPNEISNVLTEDISPNTYNYNKDILASYKRNNNDLIRSNAVNNKLTASFNILQKLINDAPEESEIILDTDYSLADGENSITITKSITINGNNHTLNGANQDQILFIGGGKSIILKNIIFTNGKANFDKGGAIINLDVSPSLTLINCVFEDNSADGDAGAIFTAGELTISDSKFQSNRAEGGNGGAIYSQESVTINNCKFEGNYADYYGGAIYSDKNINIRDSSFDNNNANDGGATYNNGNIIVINSQFNTNNVNGNSWHGRGGAMKTSGECNITLGYFGGNYAEQEGGAIYSDKNINIVDCCFDNNKASDGGAIYQTSNSELKITNSEFKKNTLRRDGSGSGGAIYTEDYCNIIINNTSFIENSAQEWGAISQYGPGTMTILNSKFISNDGYNGGAIYCQDKTMIDNTIFSNNNAYRDGGAIYSKGEITISNSTFDYNEASKSAMENYGGAICSEGLITVTNCNFTNNNAYDHGGAIYADDEIRITNSNFNSNSARMGGAIYTSTINQVVSNSIFAKNKATDGDGGAIYINNKCNPEFISCIFGEDMATKGDGGAIYLDSSSSHLTLTKCRFNANKADVDGGAIYCPGETSISDSTFEHNAATGATIERSFGGAIRSEGLITVTNCNFTNNNAYNHGGAIYADDEIRITNSNFNSNSAEVGGAIYTSTINQVVSNSIFAKNKATDGDGGAIHIDETCNSEFISCRFEENECVDKGGAIYTNRMYSHLKLSYSTFVDNKAGKSGQSVYNSGYYDLVDMCWFGTNEPSFNDQFKIWHPGSDDDYDVTNYLKISLKLNDTNPYIGNAYKATVYFSDVNGNSLNNDLLHSTGIFYGDGQFSNAKTDCNDMTSDVIFTKENPTINGKIDSQTVSLSPNVKNKETSEVHIISCENVTYPNALKVDYQITNMANKATYIIKNNAGTIIEEGEITNPKYTLTINNLNIGDYSITINNPETWTTLPSDATAKFKVSRIVSANLTANNVIYGNPTTITLKTDYDDTYKVSINNLVIEMNVVNGICQKQINLDAGEYTTQTSSNNYYIVLNCKEASFTVNKATNNVMVNVEDVTYGSPSIIKISANADGNYIVDVNGTTYDIPVKNGIGQKSINLNAGQYYANVSFNNKNYNTIAHNTTFNVYKADVDLVVVVFDEVYPDEVECIVYASRDGEYNLTVASFLTIVTVKDNFGYFEYDSLDAGSYEAIVSFAGDENYNPALNKTNFIVEPAGTSFELEINASEIRYGETATITPILSNGATGNITYYLSNGTLLGTLHINENLTLPILDVGTYVIIGKYSGDRDFNPANDSAFLTVNQAPNKVVVSASNVTYGEESLIKVDANIDGTYQLDLSGTIYNIAIKNGRWNETLKLNAGKYYANITFNNKNYKTIAKNATFSVYKADTHISIAALYTVYPQELEGIIYSDVDGKYNLTIGDYSTTIFVNRGSGGFNLGSLNAGPYTIIVNYSGDINHNPAYYTLSTTVHPAPNNAVVSVANATYGEDSLIVVSAEIDGIYQINVNGTVYNLSVSNNTGNISISLNAGTYYANLTFNNKNYKTIAKNATFSVYKADTHIFIAAFDSVYPQELEGIIYSDVDGEYNLTIGDYSDTILIKDGRAEFNAGSFNAGEYLVVVTYLGDSNHNPNSSSKEVTVSKFRPDITLNVFDIDYGGVATIIISCDVSGSVNITVNGITETLNLDNILNGYGASLSLYNLNSGLYPVSVVYNGDENFESVKVSSNFKVNALNVNMEIYTPDITIGDDEIITVNLPPIVTGDVTVTVDGKSYTTPIKDGKAIIAIPNLSAGNKEVNIYYSGDLNHNPSIRTVSFKVNKIMTKITATHITTTYKTNKYLIITLKDNNGNILRGFKIYVNLNGIREYTTDKNGQIKISTKKLVPKKYTAKIRFAGDDKYEKSSTNIKVTVKKAKPKITAKSKTFKSTTKTKKYTITLKDNRRKPIKKARISVKIGKKTYKAKTNKKGKATFKITKLKKCKTYKAIIKYKGNKYYNKLSKKVKIKIIKTKSKGNKK